MKGGESMGKICKCKFCGFKWEARVPNPKACSRCKRYDFDKPTKPKKGKVMRGGDNGK